MDQEYSEYTLFDKFFVGTVSTENMSIFNSFISRLSVFVDKDTRKVDSVNINKEFGYIIKEIGNEMFNAFILYYIYDYDYSSRRIYRYGRIMNPEKIGDLIKAISKTARIISANSNRTKVNGHIAWEFVKWYIK